VETASLAAAGWSAGVNAYLTVLVLALAGRFGWADVPESIQRPWIIAGAAVLFAVEFVVDKVPLLDSAWDVAHTLVRPTIGAALGAAIAGADLGRPQASLLAGALALSGHAAKATTRLTINLSPEPASNVVASFTEDGIVTAMVVLALTRPRLAAVLAIVAAVLSVVVAVVLARVARRGWRRVRARWAAQRRRRYDPIRSASSGDGT
jgi:Domain of unknown function (DUF4126)